MTTKYEALRIALDVLEKIACRTQTENLLWWQIEAREAITAIKQAQEPVPLKVTDMGSYALPAPKQAEAHAELLRMLATRARNFPSYPMGYHLPEVFAAVGEQPPTPPEAKA